jgi:hypothetical protein
MKEFRYLILGAALVLTISSLNMAAQQAPAQPAQPAQAAPAAPQAAPAADRTFEGQLSKVDATAKQIILTGTGNKQMTFSYTDQTQMVGVEKNNIQGLASKPGTNLKVTYREEKGSNHASKIEVVPPPKQ